MVSWLYSVVIHIHMAQVFQAAFGHGWVFKHAGLRGFQIFGEEVVHHMEMSLYIVQSYFLLTEDKIWPMHLEHLQIRFL